MKELKILLFLLLMTLSCNAQTQTENLNTYKSLIIGTWVLEGDTTYKLQFLNDNKLKIFIDNELEETSDYYLDTTCMNNQNNSFDIFLKVRIDPVTFSCDYINNLSTDGNGVTTLSITNESGNLEVYIKQ